jgi:hypothetical protein
MLDPRPESYAHAQAIAEILARAERDDHRADDDEEVDDPT